MTSEFSNTRKLLSPYFIVNYEKKSEDRIVVVGMVYITDLYEIFLN